MIIEDDESLRESFRDALRDEGYTIMDAPHGGEALAMLRGASDEKPCVILLDLMMPVMNGWQFREEQARDPELSPIPVIVVTAGRGEDTARVDADHFLQKPIRLNDLLESIRRFCRNS
jgi:CheY-like chemotaxis protein